MVQECTYTKVNLKGVVDQPLEGGKGANHDNSHGQTVPQTLETNISIDSAQGLTSTLAGLAVRVEFTDHDICGVGNGGATNTCNVTTEERNTGLGKGAVGLLGLSKSLVDLRDGSLERGELDHGVWDLACPEGVETLVQTTETLFCDNVAPALAQVVGVRWESGLHANLDGFKGAEEEVGNGFGGCRGTQVDERLVGVWEELLAVVVLEDLVGSVFTSTLERIADKGGCPTEEDTAHTLLGSNLTPCLKVGLVQLVVHLSAALDEIERCDGCVSRTAG